MNENKRYYLGNGELYTICDSSKGGSDFFNMLTKFEVVDLLNTLSEENQQLKQENTKLKELVEHFTNELKIDLGEFGIEI